MHVYLLTSIIDLTLMEGRLYATLIDYEKGFDRVTRSNLWSKLYNLGINGKVLRIVKKIFMRRLKHSYVVMMGYRISSAVA